MTSLVKFFLEALDHSLGYEVLQGINHKGRDEKNNSNKMTGTIGQELEVTNDPRVNGTLASPEQTHHVDNCLIRFLRNPFESLSPFSISYFTSLILLFVFLGLLYTVVLDDAVPGGSAFNICFLLVVAKLFGSAVEYFKLPSLLGMILAGILLKNVGLFSVSGVYEELVILLREGALSIILIKAGLGLDADALLKMSFVVLRLALLPCLAESIGVATAAYAILNFSYLWGLLLGFILSAVSPAVVVPILLHLKENGYGNDKNISTLVIAASSVDDVFAISLFGIILGCIFSEGDFTKKILRGPLDLVIGLLWGISWGVVLACFPNKNDPNVTSKRSLILGGVGLLAVIGSPLIDFSGAGPLGCITTSFVAGVCWKLQGWSNSYNPVAGVFASVWDVIQITLFGLIGTEIDLRTLDVQIIFAGILVIFCGLLCRIIACVIALIGASLNTKEVIFVNLAWLPKATVQAALAPVALSLVYKLNMENTPEEKYATNILTIAVLAILITAPIGAIGISWGGVKLLNKSEDLDQPEQSQ